MQSVFCFCILTLLFSYALTLRIPEDPLGVTVDKDTQAVEYSVQEPSESRENERWGALQEHNERSKIQGWLKAMLPAYPQNQRAFHYYSGHPFWKNYNLIPEGLPKSKRYMGVAVADFVQPKNTGLELDDDLGERGEDVGSGRPRQRKVRLLGSG